MTSEAIRRLLVLGAGIGALTLSGCGGLRTAIPNTVRLPVDQAMLVAEAGTDGINRTATAAAPVLSGTQKALVKSGLDAANNAVSAAHAAYMKGDLAAATTNLTSALADIADVQKEIKP